MIARRIAAVATVAALAACAEPPLDDAFNFTEVELVDGAESVNNAFILTFRRAQRHIVAAFERIDDVVLAEELIDAWSRGIEVEISTDVDEADAAGTQLLIEAGIPVTLNSGDLTYFDFGLNRDVAWTSDRVRMTHAFAVSDLSFWRAANQAGDMGEGVRMTLGGRSEDIGDVLRGEHNQLHAGIDATALTAFSAPAKSIIDNRWRHPTQGPEVVDLFMGPQQRPGKRIIDAAYAARSSIRLVTDDFLDEGLARALEDKARTGFDVEVIVSPRFGTLSPALSGLMERESRSVRILRTLTSEPLPTLMFIDFDRARDGRYHHPKVVMSTMPILSAGRVYEDFEVDNEQVCDSAVFVYHAQGAPTPKMQELADVYVDLRTRTESLR